MTDPEVKSILRRIRRRRIILFTASAAAVALVYILYSYIQFNIRSRPGLTDYNVYTNAQEQIKKRLKHPSTAEFTGMDYMSIYHFNDTTINATVFVDAQNDSGRVIRSMVGVREIFHPGTGQWEFPGISVTRPEIFRE